MRLRTGRDPIPGGAAHDVDPLALQITSVAPRRALLLAGIGLAAYLIALLATIPATVFVPVGGALLQVSGTVWRGEAALDGGDRLTWRFAPLRSLVNLAFAADWTIRGDGTDLGGRALRHPGGRIVLDAVSGRGDGSLLRAAMPDAAFACELALQVDLERLAIGGGEEGARGEIRSDAGSCRSNSDPAPAPTAVPALILVAEPDARLGSVFSIAPLGQRRNAIVRGSLSRGGRLSVAIGREGATVLPFAAPEGGLAVETTM